MTIQPTQLHLRTTCFFSVCHTVKLTLEEIDSLEGPEHGVFLEGVFVLLFFQKVFWCTLLYSFYESTITMDNTKVSSISKRVNC